MVFRRCSTVLTILNTILENIAAGIHTDAGARRVFYFIRWVLNFTLEYVYIICIYVAMSSCSIVFERRSYKFLESVKYNSENFIYIGSATATRFTRPVRGNSQQLYSILLDCNGIKGIDNYLVRKNVGGVLRYLGHLCAVSILNYQLCWVHFNILCTILIDNNDMSNI